MKRLKRAHKRCIRQQVNHRRKFKQRAIAAGTVTAITLGTGAGVNRAVAAYMSDPHELTVSKDADADLLTNTEEMAIGYRVFKADQNRNAVPDGVELAKRCAADINELPVWDEQGEPPNEIYKIELLFRGMEACDICGTIVNMGGVVIVNPALNLTYPEPDPCDSLAYLPYVSLHSMEHGSFDCYGSLHTCRVNVPRLMRVLDRRFPYDPNSHQLPLDANDLDSDFLTDCEELAAGYNLHDPDQDRDLVPDGIELAGQCAEVIDNLPVYEPNTPGLNELYRVDCFQKGIEQCGVCGAARNMGYWQVINPKLGLSIDVPDILCHYMSHGSFSYDGNVHGKGRIDVPLLVKILEMPRRCRDLGTVYLPGDLNEDCRANFKDLAEVAAKWLVCTDPNQDDCDKL